MIMDFILFLLTVHGKKIAKSCYSVHSSMRASNIISPEGKVKGSLSAVISSKCGRKKSRIIFSCPSDLMILLLHYTQNMGDCQSALHTFLDYRPH